MPISRNLLKNNTHMAGKVILKKTMIAALEKSMGIVHVAVEEAGINRCTHYRWLANDPKYKASVTELEDVALDFAESKLHALIKAGNVQAIIFFLKTKGKKRGYVERSELVHDLKCGKELADSLAEEEYV